MLLSEYPELSVGEIADIAQVNFKTISEHIRRLTLSGIVVKRAEGAAVRHALTDRGQRILQFLKSME